MRFYLIHLCFSIFAQQGLKTNNELMEVNYFELIGETNLKQLIKDFYIGVASDDILRSMYPMHLEPAEERLYWFMQQFLGGPRVYDEQRGLPQLRKRHFPFTIDEKGRNRWIELMMKAVEKNPMDDFAKLYLRQYFNDTATFLINRD